MYRFRLHAQISTVTLTWYLTAAMQYIAVIVTLHTKTTRESAIMIITIIATSYQLYSY